MSVQLMPQHSNPNRATDNSEPTVTIKTFCHPFGKSFLSFDIVKKTMILLPCKPKGKEAVINLISAQTIKDQFLFYQNLKC